MAMPTQLFPAQPPQSGLQGGLQGGLLGGMDPRMLGLLALGASMMSNSRAGTGPALGAGILSGMDAMNMASRNEMAQRRGQIEEQQLAMQTAQMQRQQQEIERARAQQAQLRGSLPPDQQQLFDLDPEGFSKALINQRMPEPLKPQIIGGETGGYFEVVPGSNQPARQVRGGVGFAPQAPRETWSPPEQLPGMPGLFQRSSFGRIQPVGGADPETAAMRNRAQKIADAQRLYGVDEKDATALVDGVASVATDPIKGTHTIINKATGEGRPVSMTQAQIPLTGAAAPPPSMEEVAGATGVRGVASELVSKTLGQVDPSFVDQQTTEARTQLRGLKQRLTYALSISGRPPVIEQERITALLPSEGPLESPERAKSVFKNLRDTLIRQRDADAQYINGGLASAKETPELRSRIYELDQIIRELVPEPASQPATGGGAKRIKLDAEGNIIP